MIKAGCLLTALLIFFTISHVSAQSHIIKAGSMCRYAKNNLRSKNISWEGRLQCPACDKDDAKEKIARQAEDKRREDAKAAAMAAEDLAKRRALEAELKRKREAEKGVTEVVVKMPDIKVQKSAPSSDNNGKENEMVKNYFYAPGEFDNQSIGQMTFSLLNNRTTNGSTHKPYSEENYFIVNNKKILDNDEFRYCVGVKEKRIFGNNPTNFPPNIGIVILNKSADDHVISDLVDATGKRLLNDDKISTIVHFVDDYFILLEGNYFYVGEMYQFHNGVIYNHKTKERHTMSKYRENRVRIERYVNIAHIGRQKTRDKGTYKALVTTETAHRRAMIYYITNDGKVESDEFDY